MPVEGVQLQRHTSCLHANSLPDEPHTAWPSEQECNLNEVRATPRNPVARIAKSVASGSLSGRALRLPLLGPFSPAEFLWPQLAQTIASGAGRTGSSLRSPAPARQVGRRVSPMARGSAECGAARACLPTRARRAPGRGSLLRMRTGRAHCWCCRRRMCRRAIVASCNYWPREHWSCSSRTHSLRFLVASPELRGEGNNCARVSVNF